jgi:hypothetical protein
MASCNINDGGPSGFAAGIRCTVEGVSSPQMLILTEAINQLNVMLKACEYKGSNCC